MAVEKDPVRQYLAKIGSAGGKQKVPKGFSALTPAQRRANAKKAAEARWGKGKPSKGKPKK
jgi:hypothetical protein